MISRPVPGDQMAGTLAAAVALAWRAHRRAFVGLAAVAGLTGLAPIAAAWLLRAILDDIVGHHTSARLVQLVVAMGMTGVVTAVLPSLNQYLSAQSGRAVERQSAARLFTAVGSLAGLRSLEDPAFQDQLRFAQQAGASGPGQVVSGSIAIVQSAMTLAGFIVTLAVLSPVMTAVVVAGVVPAIFLERGMARRQAALVQGITHGQRRQFFYAGLLCSVTAAKEIRLFRLGGFFRERMLAELGDVQRASARADRRVLAASTGLAVLSAAVAAAGLAWAALAASAGRLTIGDVSILVAALASGTSALTGIINSAGITYRALLMFASYRQVLATAPDLPVPAEPLPARALCSGIQMDDVWFRYGPDQPWVLRGVTCLFPRGQAIALVGHNGEGKTTLVKLLCRFYDPERGRILWDGTDLRDMDPADLRDRISVVFQDYMAYEMSAADNIGVGDLTVAWERARLHAAAEQAGIHKTLAGLPRGYQTLLTRTYFDLADRDNPQTGVLLSGGQWQRVALARAFLRGGRDLMIMDEPSAGLDADAEHELHAQLGRTRRDRATVLISHRLNTVRDANHIMVLSDGVISEQGDHDALIARGGTYARLFSRQARGYATDPVTAGSRNG
jgi:ATP-binding cassette, subfamily B, bacterial